MLVDKSCIQQIIGCLMKHPQYLSEVDKYSLTLIDFSSRFERYIFSAITGLYQSGAIAINPIDIDNYLNSDNIAKTTFTQQNGIEYLQDAFEFSNEGNFQYYYDKLKKINLLRDLSKNGIDISNYYIDNLTDQRAADINEKFESLTTQDIIDDIKKKIAHLENNYAKTGEVEVKSLAEGIEDFIENMNDTVDVGVSIQGSIYNQVISGAQKGALTIRSASSGLGKTRQAVGDACYLAYPLRYNSCKCEWEQIGSSEKVLFIVTEQTFAQITKMTLAYLTDINEDRFKYGNFSQQEKKLLKQATQIINDFSENFILIKCPNPNIELVKTLVRENVLIHNIDHVFYDYIFIGPSLLNEFRGFNLRNDEVLLMFATALKDLAVELNVSMFTSTQVNASADDNKNIRNEASLAGGRSTINKADNGAIMARPTKEEIEIFEQGGVIAKYGRPNLVTDIFKVRSGKWTQIRIWSEVDLGRLKKRDLFVTDSRLDTIDEIFDEANYIIENWTQEEKSSLIQYINNINNQK